MKTAISLPDETYERATRRAQDLGISRSEFFARAATRYLDALDADSISARIDVVLARSDDEPDESSRAAVAAGRSKLLDTDDEW